MNSNTKNIVIVCHHFPPHITGVGNVAYNHAVHLGKNGNNVTVVTSQTNQNEKSCVMDDINVIRVKALNFLEKIDAPYPIFSPRIISELYKVIRKSDIVHVHDAFYVSTLVAVLIAKFCKKPIILTQHVSLIAHPSKIIVFIEKMVYVTYGRIIFKLSKKIITYNERVRKFLVDQGVQEDKLVSIINGVDLETFSPCSIQEKINYRKYFNLEQDKKIALFVGRFVHKKGYDHVLSAKSDNYQLVFAGGEVVGGDSRHIVHLGKLSMTELSKLYKAVDMFVLPSVSEGFPLCIQEAMASGLPIITAHDFGYDSYGLDRKLFYMIDNVSNNSVKSAIENIIFDDSKIKDMSNYSRFFAEQNFNWINSMKKLNDIYSEVTSIDNRKEIAFVSDSVYPYNIGGKEKRLYEITRRLSTRGYNVTVYCMKWWNEPVDTVVIEGVKYKSISPYYALYNGEIRSMKQGIFFAIHCLKMIREKFDVLDVDHMTHLNIYTMKVVSLLKRKKMIVTWHEVWGRQYWQEYLGYILGYIAYCIELMSARLPDQIISVSEKTTNDLKNILGVNKEINTIPNGLDISFINSSKESANKSDIIFAGRLLSNKNVDILVSSVAVLRSRGIKVKVNIVGDGPEKAKLEQQVKSLGLDDSVKFLGFVKENSELYGLIKSSKVFVLPSSREGFGIAVIEANACGVPVITINDEHNAAKDLIINNENGLVCSLNDHDLADAISSIIQERHGDVDYATYSKSYDWDSLFEKFRLVYK